MRKDDLGKRLRALRTARGWSLREAASRAGMSHSFIHDIESGRTPPSLETLRRLASVYGVPPAYLLGETNEPPGTVEETEVVYIPVLGTIHAGQPIPAVEEVLEHRPVPAKLVKGDKYFFLRVKGDCMDGGPHPIKDGYLVLVRVQPTVESGQVAVVFLPGQDEAVLRRVRLVNGHVVLTADNPAYQPVLLKPDEARIVGKVVQVIFEPAAAREV